MSEHIIQHTPILLEIAMRHPIIGVITAVTLSAGGYFVPVVVEMHLPLIAMQLIQISVWTLAGIASYLTIKGYFKKKENENS